MGITKRFEIELSARIESIVFEQPYQPQMETRWTDLYESPGWASRYYEDSFSFRGLASKFRIKYALNESSKNFFQLSFAPFLGLSTSIGLNAGLGIPTEIRFHKKLRLGLMPQVIVGMGAFSQPSTNFSIRISNFPIYNFELEHSALLRYLPEPYVNFFTEYAGKWHSLPNTVNSPPYKYSAQLSLGIEFTFWKNIQFALAPSVGLFELPIQLGAKAGLAVRF